MKKKSFTITLFLLVCLLISTCNKEYVEYNINPDAHANTEKETKIIDKAEDMLPDFFLDMLEEHLIDLRNEEGYEHLLDSIFIALDSLALTILSIPDVSLDNFKTTLDTTYTNLNNLKSTNADDCIGIGYSKSVQIEVGGTGSVGAIIATSLSASGGGGISYVYDFVNLDRQIYIYTLCAYEHAIGVGVGAAMSANVGFTGIYELITGIDYHGSESGVNKFAGVTQGKSYSVNVGLIALLGLDLSIGLGTNKEAYGGFDFPNNLLPCPGNITVVENGKQGFFFQVGGSLSAGVGAEFMAAFSMGESGSESIGIPGSYRKFANNRKLASIRMAKELIFGEPLDGAFTLVNPVDIVASAIAIVYGFRDFSDCPANRPALGTLAVEQITSSSAISGGIVTNDRGANVTARGVCWHTSPSPTINHKKTVDGSGMGYFSSSITNLEPNTTYYVRAYATNSAGTSYGEQHEFKTQQATGNAPVADFLGTPTSGNAPLTVSFTDQSTNNPTSWQWSFGNGHTSTAQNPQHTYQYPGSYTVELTVSNNFGSDAEIKENYIQVNATGNAPVAAFSGTPTSGNAPLTVSFTDQSTNNPTSWQWSFGNGHTSTAQNPQHTYQYPGSYTVELTVSNNFGSDVEIKENYIQVNATGNAPVAAFSGTPTSGTAPLTVSFTDQSSNNPTSWQWSFGDGNTSTAQNPQHTYQNPGSYTVELTVENNYGADTKVRVNYITVSDDNGDPDIIYGDGVTDIDGNEYVTVIIGSQEWMAENLRTTRDANGNDITHYCYDNNTANCELYGGLYTWNAIMNGESSSSSNPSGVQGICPTGWHVPSDAEWSELLNYVVSQGYPNNLHAPNGAGNALKSCRQVGSPLGGDCDTSEHPHWNSDDTHHGFDEFGFSSLPGGFYSSSGWFANIGVNGGWWSSTENSSTFAWSRGMQFNYGDVYRANNGKAGGSSLRCVRDN